MRRWPTPLRHSPPLGFACPKSLSSLEALILLLEHYSAVAGEGIEMSALAEVEAALSHIVGLAEVDFRRVAVQWQRSVQPPSLAAFIDDLRVQCTERLRSRPH